MESNGMADMKSKWIRVEPGTYDQLDAIKAEREALLRGEGLTGVRAMFPMDAVIRELLDMERDLR